ncbi:MAG: flagellar biosynthesis repressor FlbT [Rhodospirillales bacterium]
MPLKLEMKQGDRIIINGAVLEAASPHTKFVVHNQAAILRGKEILSEEQSVTPATRVYFALQSAYLFPEHAETYLNQFWLYIDQYLDACPSAAEIVDEIKDKVYEGKLYPALKSSQKLILHQQGVLKDLERAVEEFAETGGGIDDVIEGDAEEVDTDEAGKGASA